MNLLGILQEIKEQNLSKGQLETLEQRLSALYAEYQLEIADLKKERALYFLERQKPEVSDVSIRRLWDAGTNGQRLIECEHSVKAVAKMLSSIKSRIFQTY